MTPQIASAANQTVTNCNDSGTGSLREAVRDAPAGGAVTFALPPTCNTIELASTIRITHAVSIDGPGPKSVTVSGKGEVGVFAVASGVKADIDGIAISQGGGNYNGGGIYNSGTLTVADSELLLNDTNGVGGGISNVGGILIVTGSTLSANSASSLGGGIFNDSASTLTVTDSTISYNDAESGGAILNEGTATVTDSTILGNGAGEGGGGGIYNSATLEVTGSTLSANEAAGVGGGILNVGYASLASTMIARSRYGHACSGRISDAGYNLDDDGSCGFSRADHSLSDMDPELGPLSDNGGPTNTVSPAMGSPVLDRIPQKATGNGTTLCSGTDQRGVPRPTQSNCDIGAVEMERDVAEVRSAFSLKVTTFGSTAPAITEKGNLPSGVEFTDNGNGTATIAGTPQTTGVSVFTIKARFGAGPTRSIVKQVFTLTVNSG